MYGERNTVGNNLKIIFQNVRKSNFLSSDY